MFNLLQKKDKQQSNTSLLVRKGTKRDLYKTKDGLLFWLDSNKYLDQCIIKSGVFEDKSTKLVKKLVKKGNIVLDIGANIGYYSVIFSKLVGESGKVFAFEPTNFYGEILKQNIIENQITNCEFLNFGLSNKNEELEINIGECSATLHWVYDIQPSNQEYIKLMTLDSFIKQSKALERIDFIKIDVDGHEPMFLEGAKDTLQKFNPIILIEVNHENYLDVGVTAWDFYSYLKDNNYYIYCEDDLTEFKTKREFLVKCGNFAYSANIIISKTSISDLV